MPTDLEPGAATPPRKKAVRQTASPAASKEGKESARIEPPVDRAGYDATDTLLTFVRDRIAYNQDRGDYWRKTDAGQFVKASETDLKRHLRRAGYDLFSNVDGRFQFTRFDNAICYAQDHAAVAAVFDLAGHRSGVFTSDGGRRVLIPTGAKLISPVKGSVANFQRLHVELFGEGQIDRVLAWTKCALEDYYSLTPVRWRHSQLLCLVGPPKCGKSFWQILLTRLFNAGEADSWPTLTGGDAGKFTKDLAEAPHWLMQDKAPFRNLANRAQFTANAKTHLVSSTLDVHAKGRDKMTLPTFRRVTLSTNDDADYLTVIPNLDDSMRDKLLVVKCGKATMLPDFQANLARFVAELPAWIYHLLYDYKVPVEMTDERMGVVAWCHSDIEGQLRESDPAPRLLELIDEVLFRDDRGERTDCPLKLSATEVQARLVCDPKFGSIARQILPASSVCGQLLAKLAKEHPKRFDKKTIHGSPKWTICAP